MLLSAPPNTACFLPSFLPQTRDLRERLARAESHLGGALGELQTVVGAELGSVKEVLAQLEAAMNQGEEHVF